MNLAHLLTQTITVAARTGVDANGDPTYGAATPLPGYVERAEGVANEGPKGTTNTDMWKVATTTRIEPESRVWLPGESTADAGAARLAGRSTAVYNPWSGVTDYYLTEV
jgi:hypothetical protein